MLALACLAATLSACGDSGSSSSGSDETSCAEESSCDNPDADSSTVTPKDSDDEDDNGSDGEKAKSSSSSVEKAKSSSSSAKPDGGDKNSSSGGKAESADSKSSSSSAKPDSSGDTPSSSSSKTGPAQANTSSSSYNRTHWFSGPLWRGGEYKTFIDDRDGREYYYLTYVGKDTSGMYDTISVMSENLNIGEMVPGDGDQADDSKIERYCYDNDTLKCMEYGGLYQWAEMMQLPSECNTKSCADLIQPNHQGICPSGWHLLTYNDFHIVVYSMGNPDKVKGVRAGPFGGNNDSGYSLVGAGYNWNYEFSHITKTTYWHYPQELEGYEDDSSLSGAQTNSSTGISSNRALKTHGFSVRCVMDK